MSNKVFIKKRIAKIKAERDSPAIARATSLERSRKLKSLEVTGAKIDDQIRILKTTIEQCEKDLASANSQKEIVDGELKKIEDHTSPVVTEHGLLRYIERFWGVDLELAHKEILRLPDAEVIRSGRTIVTVFPDKEDHFNLAEREKF